MNLIERLQWRYATKKYDASKTVPEAAVQRIVEAIRLAPTSSGLQPFELLVITNKELREKLKGPAMNQGQVTDCSHLIVFAAWDTYTEARINQAFDLVNEVRGAKNEGWENYRKFLLSTYPARDAEVNFHHAAKQAYIGLGVGLVAAACEGVDSTPMEGFDPAAFDALLGLKEKGLRSVVLLPLGYRDTPNDWLVNLKMVRNAVSRFVTEIR